MLPQSSNAAVSPVARSKITIAHQTPSGSWLCGDPGPCGYSQAIGLKPSVRRPARVPWLHAQREEFDALLRLPHPSGQFVLDSVDVDGAAVVRLLGTRRFAVVLKQRPAIAIIVFHQTSPFKSSLSSLIERQIRSRPSARSTRVAMSKRS